TIACDATDGAGLVGEAAITVHVVDNFPPVVTIAAPADGDTFGANASITFRGSAFDPETGTLAGTALHWLDGAASLGNGAVVVTSLPIGDHVIALDATDPDAVVGRA